MKKFALVLAIILSVSSLAFAAAPAKKVAAEPAPASSSSSSQGFIGVSLNQIPCNPFTAPTARFGFGGWSLDVGGSIMNNAAGTGTTLYGRGEIPISTIGSAVKTYWGPSLCLASPAGGGGSTTVISVFLGAEYMFADHLALFADLTAFSLVSAGGTSTWTIGSNSGTIYSGGRLYF